MSQWQDRTTEVTFPLRTGGGVTVRVKVADHVDAPPFTPPLPGARVTETLVYDVAVVGDVSANEADELRRWYASGANWQQAPDFIAPPHEAAWAQVDREIFDFVRRG